MKKKEKVFTIHDYYNDDRAVKDLNEARSKLVEQMEDKGAQIVEKTLLNDKKQQLEQVELERGIVKEKIKGYKMSKFGRIMESVATGIWYAVGGLNTAMLIQDFCNGDMLLGGLRIAVSALAFAAGGLQHAAENHEYKYRRAKEEKEKQFQAEKELFNQTQKQEILQKEIAYLKASTAELP